MRIPTTRYITNAPITLSALSIIMPGSSMPSDDSVATMASTSTTDRSFGKWRVWASFGSAILNCLCAGSILLFSLWAPIFQQKLGYSQLQINAISIASELGMYLPVPIFGYICDHFGPDKLSLLTAAFFGPGYFLASLAYSHAFPYQLMVVAFGLVGMGTSSMYFSGVTTCAKNFTGSRGLALSLPITSFGLSSLWESQFVSRVFVDGSGALMVRSAFVAFAVFLAGVGVLGGMCLRVSPQEGGKGEEGERLLGDDGEGGGYAGVDGENEKRWINAATREFLRDKTMWWFAVGVFLVTGPGEAFINNMGTLLQTLTPPNAAPIDPTTHVSIIASTSTLSRILSGLLSDHLTRRRRTRMTLLFLSATLLLTAHILLVSGFAQQHTSRLRLISALVGTGYGAVFTLAPTIVSVVWGTRNFGTNWGIVVMAPAASATAYGLLYAAVYDAHAGDDRTCSGRGCYGVSFAVMAAGTVAAVAGWVWAWRGRGGWVGRGVIV